MSNNNDESIEEVRAVPMDLLPPRTEHLNEDWAKRTFKYCHYFNKNINYTAFDQNSNDILCWLETAINLVNELKDLGVVAGEEHVVKLGRDNYSLKMVGTKDIAPTSVNDILSIFENKWYYLKNRENILKQVYYMTYALGRNGTNGWALAVERFFLKKYNIKYSSDLVRDNVKKRHKGCFYQYIVLRFNKTNIRRFQHTLENNHQEYLTAKRKGKSHSQTATFEWMSFGEGGAWLVRNKDFQNVGIKNVNNITLIDQGEEWVKECLRAGYTGEFLKQQVNLWTNIKETDTDLEIDEGKITFGKGRIIVEFDANYFQTLALLNIARLKKTMAGTLHDWAITTEKTETHGELLHNVLKIYRTFLLYNI